MRSYLVLTPPDGPEWDHHSTLVLKDGFSWLALFFPWIWLLFQRLWLAGIAVVLAQIGCGLLTNIPGLELAGFLGALSINLLVALEGRHYRSEALIRRGWKLEAVISAPDLSTAEQIYFSGLSREETRRLPASDDWAKGARPSGSSWQGPNLGLFDYQGGR